MAVGLQRRWLGMFMTGTCCGLLLLIAVMAACKSGSCQGESSSDACSSNSVADCEDQAGCWWRSSSGSCTAMLILQAVVGAFTLLACCCCCYHLGSDSCGPPRKWLNWPGMLPGTAGPFFKPECKNADGVLQVVDSRQSGRKTCLVICVFLVVTSSLSYLIAHQSDVTSSSQRE